MMCAVPSRVVFCMVSNGMFGEICLFFLFIVVLTVPSAPTTIGMVLIFFKFQHFCTSISRSRYLVIFSASFFVTFVHDGIATSMNIHSRVFVLWMVMSGLLCFIFLSVMIGLSHNIVMSVCMVLS